jgi:hypothetical protein
MQNEDSSQNEISMELDSQEELVQSQPSSRLKLFQNTYYGFRTFATIFVGLALIISLYVIGVVGFKSRNKDETLLYLDVDYGNQSTEFSSEDYVTLQYSINGYNPVDKTITGRLLILTNGIFSKTSELSLARNLTVMINFNKFDLEPTGFLQTRTFTDSADSGDVLDYPFDKYPCVVYIAAFTGSRDPDAENTIPVPFKLVVDSTLSGLSTSLLSSDPNSKETFPFILFTIQFTRAGTTIGYCMFLTTASWILTLLIVVVSIDTYKRNRDIPAPFLAFLGACLFALPAMRNSQPQVPQVGTWQDFMGFFWHIGLITLSLCFVLTLYIFRFKSVPKPAQAPKPNVLKAA